MEKTPPHSAVINTEKYIGPRLNFWICLFREAIYASSNSVHHLASLL
jgi:hypothetical protein